MSFYPGQHVVCVDDTEQSSPQSVGIKPVIKGTVYTVRDFLNATPWGGDLGVRLGEIINPLHPKWGCEYGYLISRFRPLKDSRLDVFRQHLVSPPKERIEA